MKRYLRPALLLLLALTPLTGAGLACSRAVGTAANPPTPAAAPPAAGVVELSSQQAERAAIETAIARRHPVPRILETTGSVDFDQARQAHVSPRLPGRIDSVPARLGARVRRGEVLARIDSTELGQAKAEYLQARAREELARESFEREQGLFADRISSEQEMLSARAAFREAQAALLAADETLHLYGLSQGEVDSLHYDDPQSSILEVRAPFAGKVIDRHATLGELVTPSDVLFLLADLSRVWIWIDVYERDLGGVRLGDAVEVRTEAFPDQAFHGEVSYLSDRVDPDSRALRARIDVPNPRGHLRPGMFVRVVLSDLRAGDRMSAQLPPAVPESAVARFGRASVVFVPLGPGRFERRQVHLGRRGGGWVEVLSGLAAGESVVAGGTFLLKSEASRDQLGGEE